MNVFAICITLPGWLHAEETVNSCPEGMNERENLCYCGEHGLSLKDAQTWTCIDDSHFLCLKRNGCSILNATLPTWSFWGDTSRSFDHDLPVYPANLYGYRMANTPKGYAWLCDNQDGCLCGTDHISGTSLYHEQCTVDQTETREGYLTIKKPLKQKSYQIYRNAMMNFKYILTLCEEFAPICAPLQASVAYRLGVSTNDIGKMFPEYHDFFKAKESDNICGDVDMNTMDNHSGYKCIDESLICQSSNGCECGEHRVVKDAECKNGIQYCSRIKAEWIDPKDISQYRCIAQIVCAKDKCKCGDHTCRKGESCFDGECVCGNTDTPDGNLHFNEIAEDVHSQKVCNDRTKITLYEEDLCFCQKGDLDSSCNCPEEEMDSPDCGYKCDQGSYRSARLEIGHRVGDMRFLVLDDEIAASCTHCDDCDGFRVETLCIDDKGCTDYAAVDCRNRNGDESSDASWYAPIGHLDYISQDLSDVDLYEPDDISYIRPEEIKAVRDGFYYDIKDYYINNKEIHKTTCNYLGSSIDIFYHFNYQDCGPAFEECEESQKDDSVAPCTECASAENFPRQEALISKKYCDIMHNYYVPDASDAVLEHPVQAVWHDLSTLWTDSPKYDFRQCNDNLVAEGESPVCECGNQKMNTKDAQSYSCEIGLAWRCEENACPCGPVTCKKDDICLKPGECR